MGCDIHLHIEFNDLNHWWHWADPWFSRDYNAFEAMAFVRGDRGLFKPRDIPKDVTFETKQAYTLRIVKPGQVVQEGECTAEIAREYIAQGSYMWDERHVTHPDWHTPSWLTCDELIEVANHLDHANRDLEAIIGAMKALPQSRLVFWFDN